MSLGNNRDYVKTDRVTRKRLAAHKARMDRLIDAGMTKEEASKAALRSASCDGKPDECSTWNWLHDAPDDQKLWQLCLSIAYGNEVKDPVGTAKGMYSVRGGTTK